MESTYLKLEYVAPALIGRLKCEKLAERESNVMLAEISNVAGEASWKIALDLEEVMLVASVGLGALVTLNKNCKANSGKLVVFNMAEEILESLKLSRLDRIITIVSDQAAALKALS
ncbi:MAG: STAS domain-containing protein [Phycisphaerales bacterium]|jgi:anti-anti-sigma factor|nr:STAS domain-containing protein [Phycisphaerales bacterium]